jgi:methionyl-tRNA synthetase
MGIQHPDSLQGSQKYRKILVTTALPYANGSLHLGHIFEGIYADIWVRFQKLRGHEVYFFCADDTHGTPVMVEARKRGLTPEQLIEKIYQDHCADYAGFQIEHSHYSSTNSKTNESLIQFFMKK